MTKYTHDKEGAIVPVFEASAEDRDTKFVAAPGDNSMTVKVGGAEVEIAVIDGELDITTSAPGKLDPVIFRIAERFGTATVVYRDQGGRPFSYKDLHPHNRDA